MIPLLSRFQCLSCRNRLAYTRSHAHFSEINNVPEVVKRVFAETVNFSPVPRSKAPCSLYIGTRWVVSFTLRPLYPKKSSHSGVESILCAAICDPQSTNNIRRWYQQLQTTGCLCKGKSAGRPRVERVRQTFLRSPKKSVSHASRELAMSTMTVWWVLRKRLEMKAYRLHLLQFLQLFWYTV
jgi:hypothetical protein